MNTDARARARQYYHAAGRQMEPDLEALRQHPQGVVLMMPQLVALLKPVAAQNADHWQQLEQVTPHPDAWYVHLLVGDLRLARQLARALPPLQWLCFQRGLRSPRPHRLPWLRILSPDNNTPTPQYYGIQQH